jgi:hypothetical protein
MLRQVSGLLTCYYHLKEHIFKLEPADRTACDRSLSKEKQYHILCECEALDELRFCHLQMRFMKTSDYQNAVPFV